MVTLSLSSSHPPSSQWQRGEVRKSRPPSRPYVNAGAAQTPQRRARAKVGGIGGGGSGKGATGRGGKRGSQGRFTEVWKERWARRPGHVRVTSSGWLGPPAERPTCPTSSAGPLCQDPAQVLSHLCPPRVGRLFSEDRGPAKL